MPRTGSNFRESRCGRRGAAAAVKMASRRRFSECFWALTPVALRAPCVSAQKHRKPNGRKGGVFPYVREPRTRNQAKQPKPLTDVDHYFTLGEPCVASLRSDRHQIGLTDRHHRNAQSGIASWISTNICLLEGDLWKSR